jgi:hypothetical protein
MAGDGVLERLDDHFREHRGGIVTDLLFAVAWVTLVNALFRVVDGPTWAYYFLWPPASSPITASSSRWRRRPPRGMTDAASPDRRPFDARPTTAIGLTRPGPYCRA